MLIGIGFDLRYLIDILYTNTLLMNLSNTVVRVTKKIKLKSLILAQIERWWYA